MSLADLEDIEFVNDNEILKYTLRKDTVKSQDSFHIYTSQMFEVSPEVTKRVNSLKILLCCGRQFALVIDGSIVYSGYFWNMVSSFGCNGITALAYGGRIELLRKLPDYDIAKRLRRSKAK